MATIPYLTALLSWVRARADRIRMDESGSPTLETMIIAGVLAAAAITAGAIVVSRIMTHAHSIQ
ncbi:MAG TPA: hypothetical protein VFH45_04380 [Acidimicrobiales bacterium]|nr:hypothetical protein [Acidimicrobiales bacterium]